MRGSAILRTLTPRAALKVLSLPTSAQLTHASIKKAYIQQALRCHPDLNPTDPKANENFQTLSEALRVALQALELTGASGRQGDVRRQSSDAYDSQAALESLRQSILAYQAHRRAHIRSQTDGSVDADPHAASHDVRDPFTTPSLEYVSNVCQEEAVAMRRVQTFCENLPSVLCGSRSAALFEAVAFFHTHYVTSMAECVMRFSQNLPVIVRRVVRNRKQFVRYSKSPKSASGMGTGTRPREQRIEDMSMKPLVLVGALVFDVHKHDRSGARANGGGDSEADFARSTSPGDAGGSSSTCGVSRLDDIEVTKELMCVVYPDDSIGSITEKLNKWEAASFHRLKLELAIADATTLVSNLVGLEEAGTALSVPPHLQLSFAETERVLLTVQKVSCDLCLHYDEHTNFDVSQEESVVAGQWLEEETRAAAEDDAASHAPVGQLIAECRMLAKEAAPLVKDNLLLTWRNDTVFVESADAVARQADSAAETEEDDGESRKETQDHIRVARHFSCCDAETTAYSLSMELCKDVKPFLLRLRAALRATLRDAHQSQKLLGDLLALRDKTVHEEFIPTSPETHGRSDAPGNEGGAEAAEPTFRYRGPIFCFPRLYNMNTMREKLWWQRLHSEREYVAAHAAAMNVINVFYDCLPYDPTRLDTVRPLSDDVSGGWVGGAADGSGDHVVLARATLDSPSAFREWLEEVVEQSSLSREVQTELDRAGIGYFSRDPTLPLTNYLSFVRLFVSAAAVRAVLESKAHAKEEPNTSRATARTVTSADIGLSVTVGYQCGVRDGGQLLIPWYMDPNALLALLAEAAATAELPAA